jgi:hypothetical protein
MIIIHLIQFNKNKNKRHLYAKSFFIYVLILALYWVQLTILNRLCQNVSSTNSRKNLYTYLFIIQAVLKKTAQAIII